MGKVGNVPIDIQEGIRDALGRKIKIAFARIVNLEVKPEKFDTRVLALNEHRVFILTSKNPMKLETNLHFLDINLLESKSPRKMIIGTESKRLVMQSNSPDEKSDEFDSAVGHIIVSLAKVFPNVLTEKLIAKIEFAPPTRLQDFRTIGAHVGQRDEGPCGNFSTMYRCMCDYHGMEVQEDVAWDVDMIYLSHNSKEMNLKDFDHLDGRHLLPIVSALEHNMWFTKLNASNVKLSPEAMNEILKMMKSNAVIEELVLANINVRADFCQRLCMSLVNNTGSPLTTLDLSGNVIEDRGLNHLCAPITKLSRGLVELNLSRTGITARGVNKLAEALLVNKNIPLNLRCLDLSENSFKGEDVSNLLNFLAQPNTLTDLRLGSCECSLESLFAALQRGCAQSLANLDISNNAFSYRKTGKDVSVPPSWKQFFASAINLKKLNFSGCRLPPDALRSVLDGIGSNPSLTEVELNLSNNGFGLPGNQGGQILETYLCNVRNISHLDLSDNGFDAALANILMKLSQNKGLQKLSIGRNLNNIKPKNVPQVIDAMIQLIHQENSPLMCLNVDNLRLKSETVVFINALGINDSLTEIDISGNQMGDNGARMLSKALQINKKLSVVYWDHNGTTPNGFHDIATALEKNYTLHKMPTPINDAAQALRLNQEKTEHALQKIENILHRNQGSRRTQMDQAYRLHQNIMMSNLQQTMDVQLVLLQDHIAKYENLQQKFELGNACSNAEEEIAKARALLKEADCTKTLLLQLQRIVQESESSNSFKKDLNALGNSLCDVATKDLKTNLSAMISCAQNLFPVTLENEALQNELLTASEKRSQLPAEFVQNVMLGRLSSDVADKLSELNLSAASHISDLVLDEYMNEVEKSVHSLKSILNSARSHLIITGQLKDEDAESKEHRENLRRNKSTSSSVTTDEDQDTTTELASVSNKHKSQLNRRFRPQSAIDASDVKRALELCREKTDLSAVSDLELHIESGYERSSSEERVLESDDSKNSSPLPTPLPRKRKGQPNGKTKGAVAGSVSKSDVCLTHEKPVADDGKGGSPRKADLSADQSGKILQRVSSQSPQILEQAAANADTVLPLDSTRLPSKTELSAHGTDSVSASTTDTYQHKSDTSLIGTGGVSQAIKNSGEVLNKVVAESSVALSSSEVVKGEERPKQSASGQSFSQSSRTAVEEKAVALKFEEVPKVSRQPAVKKKDNSLEQTDGKNSPAERPNLHNSSLDFFPADDAPAPRLEHLGKGRPKRPKNRAVTRPMAYDLVIDEDDVSRGVSEFFGAKSNSENHQTQRKENGEVNLPEEPEEVVKPETASKKEKAKAPAISPKVESKGFASNLMSLFKKKSPEGETPPPPTQKSAEDLSASENNQTSKKNEEKPLESGDNLKPSDEVSRKASETEESAESRPKQPAGVQKIGLPGMAGGISLAELRSKKAAAKHVPSFIENEKTSTVEATREKEVRSSDKKSLTKEPNELQLPSSEDNISGVTSRLSGSIKGRPPPPLAPKPNKRSSVGSTAPANATTASPSATAAAPKPEAEELQESDQKPSVLQSIDTAVADRKKRLSVREKAANIDKNSNLRSSDGSGAGKVLAATTTDGSAKSSESLAHQPSCDGSSVSLTSSSLSTSGPDSETPPVLPSESPDDADNDEDAKSKSAAKRPSSGVDVIHI